MKRMIVASRRPSVSSRCGSCGVAARTARPLPGDPLPGHHGRRVRGVPARPRRLHRGRDGRGRPGPGVQRHRAAPSATTCRRSAAAASSPKCARRAATSTGEFVELAPTSGSLFQMFSIPTHACQPVIPPEANVIARRVPIPLFGAGLVEAIPDETLLALEDPDDRDRDGISGRARDRHRHRHRRSAASAGSAGRRSTRRCWRSAPTPTGTRWASPTICFPQELAFGISPEQMKLCDPIPDPEDRPRSADAPARHRQLRGVHEVPRAGRARADRRHRARRRGGSSPAIGCAACHVPALQTGPSANPVFNRKAVPLFSDLLLHDVGTGDGIRQEAADAAGVRTPALWGSAAAPAAAARRQRRDDRRRDRFSRQRGATGANAVSRAARRATSGADCVPEVAVTTSTQPELQISDSFLCSPCR